MVWAGAARFAALLFLLSPLTWFHGIVGLVYIVEAFLSAVAGYFCWQVYVGRKGFAIPAALVLDWGRASGLLSRSFWRRSFSSRSGACPGSGPAQQSESRYSPCLPGSCPWWKRAADSTGICAPYRPVAHRGWPSNGLQFVAINLGRPNSGDRVHRRGVLRAGNPSVRARPCGKQTLRRYGHLRTAVRGRRLAPLQRAAANNNDSRNQPLNPDRRRETGQGSF